MPAAKKGTYLLQVLSVCGHRIVHALYTLRDLHAASDVALQSEKQGGEVKQHHYYESIRNLLINWNNVSKERADLEVALQPKQKKREVNFGEEN